MYKIYWSIVALLLLLASCDGGKKKVEEQPTLSGLYPSKFVTTIDEKPTKLYVMKNANGMEVCVTNIGGRIVSVMVPDKNGKMQDVVLGFDNIKDYEPFTTNFGAIIGRYANRIAKGEFMLRNNLKCKLRVNNGENTLHGGPRGFHTRYFQIEQVDDQTLVCTYLSKDQEEGFPSELLTTVTYRLTDDNAIDISYEARSNQLTVVNLTNHSYFNLSGDPNKNILDHVLFLDCDRYTPTKADLIPTGKIDKVTKTPLDFTTPTAIGKRINDTSFIAIKFGLGYDHNYVLNKPGDISNVCARVVCPNTGIKMEVFTTEPGIQFYTGNFLDGSNIGKKGISYGYRSAFCLETQHFPDSPNQPSFPCTELHPDSTYKSRSIYKFGIE